MAVPSSAPTGFGVGFDASAFRAAIRATMVMGLPNSAGEQATFKWTKQRTYGRQDAAKKPFHWDTTPATEVTHADVQVPVAMEFTARPAASQQTTVGEFDATKVVLTVLDVDYALVEGADLVQINDATYEIDFVAPPIGLFEVTVYSVYCSARDEA